MLDYSNVASAMVKRFVTTELYPTDTPIFRVEPLSVVRYHHPTRGARVVLTTTLPDGMLYTVIWVDDNTPPVLKAYKEIDLEDLTPH